MTKKILVTGAQGQVGRALQALATDFPKFNFQFAGREQLDITQQAQVDDYFHTHQPDVCINCAAYTAVVQAESDPEQAFLINEQAVGFLAKACQNQQSHFLHISSDYVYHNSLNRPLRESDPCMPQGIYAQSKLALTMWSRTMAHLHKNRALVFVAVNPGSLLATKMVKEGFDMAGNDIRLGDVIVKGRPYEQ